MSDATSGRFADGKHLFSLRVYYEDTDAAGIVYYANYLKFAERARTEALRLAGIDQSTLLAESGVGFVVRQCHVDFLRPAQLDDMLTLETTLHDIRKASMTMRQLVTGHGGLLVTLTVKIACVGEGIKPVAIPDDIVTKLCKHLQLT